MSVSTLEPYTNAEYFCISQEKANSILINYDENFNQAILSLNDYETEQMFLNSLLNVYESKDMLPVEYLDQLRVIYEEQYNSGEEALFKLSDSLCENKTIFDTEFLSNIYNSRKGAALASLDDYTLVDYSINLEDNSLTSEGNLDDTIYDGTIGNLDLGNNNPSDPSINHGSENMDGISYDGLGNEINEDENSTNESIILEKRNDGGTNPSVSMYGTLDGHPFIGILVNNDAAIALYNCFVDFVNLGNQFIKQFFYSNGQDLAPYAWSVTALTLAISTTLTALLIKGGATAISFCAGHPIAALVALIVIAFAACIIAIISRIIAYGSKGLGWACGFEIVKWYKWESINTSYDSVSKTTCFVD